MQEKGFSLLEMLVVSLIAGVLVTMAAPSWKSHVLQAHRSAAKTLLLTIQIRQESFFTNNRTYATDLAALGFPVPLFIDKSGKYVASSSASYHVTMLVESDTYSLSASPVNQQREDKCAVLTIKQTGHKIPASCW